MKLDKLIQMRGSASKCQKIEHPAVMALTAGKPVMIIHHPLGIAQQALMSLRPISHTKQSKTGHKTQSHESH